MAIKGVANQLQLVFDEYVERLNIKTDNIMSETAKETADELRRISPKGKGARGGAYARSWTVKQDKRNHHYIVHNKDHYRLTHLLEYGHVVKNQYGTYDRTNAYPHIYRAEQDGIKTLFRKLENEL